MEQIGHIEIQGNKIAFVYHELEKPQLTKEDYFESDKNYQISKEYNRKLEEYNASKREVEVEKFYKIGDEYFCEYYFSYCNIKDIYTNQLKNGQSCEVSIINNKAIITKVKYYT